jgi:hypothetical protein
MLSYYVFGIYNLNLGVMHLILAQLLTLIGFY